MEYKDLTEEEKKNILLHYLKDFAIYFNDEEEALFQEKLHNLDSCLIRANNYDLLRKAICFILLNLQRKVRYLYKKSNDIIDIMLNDDQESCLSDEEYNFKDIQEVSLLIIYHPNLGKRTKSCGKH